MKDDGQRTRQQPRAKSETVTDQLDNDLSAELGAQRSSAVAPSNAAVATRAASSRGAQLPATSAPAIQTKRPSGPPAPVRQGLNHGRTWAAPASDGAPLAPNVRQPMETSFGADFSSVRVHQGDGTAESLGARAFARGENIHVASGEPGFNTSAGKELLGHELSHVVQQRSGKVIAEQGKGSVVGDPGLEAEADRAGAAVARGERAVVAGATQRTTPAAVAVQAKRSKVGTRHRTKEYRNKLKFNMNEELARIHKILQGGSATDRKKFITVADALSGLAIGDPDDAYDQKYGKTLKEALNTAYANKPWQLRYLQNLRRDSAPDPIDKLALYLGLVTHGKGARAAFRPGDPKRVLELLETDFPTGALWKVFTWARYTEFRVAITQLERIESQVADRIHALRRARGINADAPATRPAHCPDQRHYNKTEGHADQCVGRQETGFGKDLQGRRRIRPAPVHRRRGRQGPARRGGLRAGPVRAPLHATNQSQGAKKGPHGRSLPLSAARTARAQAGGQGHAHDRQARGRTSGEHRAPPRPRR